MEEKTKPKWLKENGSLDEVTFAREFLKYRRMVCVEGAFFTRYGKVSNMEQLRREIYLMLCEEIRTGVSRKVERVLEVMRMESYRDQLPMEEDRIHVANGCLHLDGDLDPQLSYCRYRLPVRYNPKSFRPPRQWLQFLDQLLHEEDIPTLQEFMGYCLIPSTRAQKMLIITGKGGEGKSRIGVVMKALLGVNMNVGSVAKLESSPFARADLQHQLLMVDDDLKMEALTQTNHIKSIVTAELPMDLERKGVQSYQGNIHARLMAFGNGNLHALYDRSYGFFRRQIILSTKDKDPGRVDDPFLGEKLLEEKEGIFLWCLEGLQRLRKNNYRFTISRRATQNLYNSLTEGNNVLSFLKSQGYFRFDPEGSITSRQFYAIYRDWCTDNSFPALNDRSFFSAIREQSSSLNLTASSHLSIGNGKQARGYIGIRACQRL